MDVCVRASKISVLSKVTVMFFFFHYYFLTCRFSRSPTGLDHMMCVMEADGLDEDLFPTL